MCLACLCCVFILGCLLLHVYDSSLSFSLASASPRPAGNTQPWLWNVFTFWACYKLSAKTNFAWLGRSLHLAQMLFGSNVFQGFALSIWLSLSDRASPSQMWTQAKGKARALCWCVCVPARMCLHLCMSIWCGQPANMSTIILLLRQDSTYTQYNINSEGINVTSEPCRCIFIFHHKEIHLFSTCITTSEPPLSDWVMLFMHIIHWGLSTDSKLFPNVSFQCVFNLLKDNINRFDYLVIKPAKLEVGCLIEDCSHIRVWKTVAV